jgi:hypothetical protein
VKNPDAQNAAPRISAGAPARLPATVLVYSKGADGKAQTQDDIVSWRN